MNQTSTTVNRVDADGEKCELWSQSHLGIYPQLYLLVSAPKTIEWN